MTETAQQPKRILIFALTYYPKFVGGDGVAVKAITDRIDPAHYEFHMITLWLDSTLPKYEQFGNVHIHRVGFAKKEPTPESLVRFPMYFTKVWYPIGAFFKAVSLHRRKQFDLIWAMMAYAGFPAVFFNFLYKQVPLLLTLQDGDPIEKIVGRARIKFVMPLFKRIFKITDHLQSISTYLENFARQMGYQGSATIVPNGVDYEKFSTRDDAAVAAIKTQYDKGDEFWLFTASRLVEKNANDIVIRALADLPNNVKFYIAGVGPDKQMLQELAQHEGVADRVIFLGQLTHDELPHYLRAADAFIRPSRTEGFGNSFVEAMAAETPVIATTAGGIKDFLFHDENGLEVGIDSVEDVVTQTKRLMHNAALREEIVSNARVMAAEKYDWKVITQQMVSIFDQMTNAHK